MTIAEKQAPPRRRQQDSRPEITAAGVLAELYPDLMFKRRLIKETFSFKPVIGDGDGWTVYSYERHLPRPTDDPALSGYHPERYQERPLLGGTQ